jgi:hypothetical protein
VAYERQDDASLIDELRESAAAVPPSHLPGPSELAGIVGALILYHQYGPDFLEAAADEDRVSAVDGLIAPRQDEGEPEPKQTKGDDSDTKQTKKGSS